MSASPSAVCMLSLLSDVEAVPVGVLYTRSCILVSEESGALPGYTCRADISNEYRVPSAV